MNNSYVLQIHFGGYIAREHLVSMRTLGKTMFHLQAAVDRACLEIHHGRLVKHTRMPQKLWDEAELIVGPSRDGGYILDFLTRSPKSKQILERVNTAIKSAVEKMAKEGIEQTKTLAEQATQREIQINKGIIEPTAYMAAASDPRIIRTYGDRAIVREVDQILSIVRSSAAGESYFEMTMATKSPMKYSFNKKDAKLFHDIVARREIGVPLIYKARVRSLDKGNRSAKIINLESNRQANLYFGDEGALLLLVPYFEKNSEVIFYGAPMIEYGAFDPAAGDILFVSLPSKR
jgi:hypothetical protein